MEVTIPTWIVTATGLVLIGLLGSLQMVTLFRSRSEWTIDNVYGRHTLATVET